MIRRPLYADPGLVPTDKTPHPDAPTAPRTADTGAVTATNSAQAAGMTAPMPASSPADSYIASLMRPPNTLAERVGPLNPVFQNPVGINPFLRTPPPLSGGQLFLRNLVGGFNSRANPMAGGKGGMTLQQLLSYQNTQADNARADRQLAEMMRYHGEMQDERQQFHADLQNQRAVTDARLQEQFAALQRERAIDNTRSDRYLSIAMAGLGLRRNADARSQERLNRAVQAENAYSKLPPALKVSIDSARQAVAAKIIAARQNGVDYDPSPELDLIDQRVLNWSQTAGTQSDPFAPPTAPGPRQGPAPIPPDAKGARAAAGVPRQPVRPSQNPALDAKTRDWFKKNPKLDVPQ